MTETYKDPRTRTMDTSETLFKRKNIRRTRRLCRAFSIKKGVNPISITLNTLYVDENSDNMILDLSEDQLCIESTNMAEDALFEVWDNEIDEHWNSYLD